MREKLIELLYDAMFFEGYGRELCEQQADHLIANGVTVQEWISVKDRLPVKESQAYEREWAEYPMYIVMIDKAFLPNSLYYDWRDSVWFDFRDDGTIAEYQVTHWMPLPQPPKGEENE